jgi:pimeloyl-ACP methyl ester carboxylesterase
VTLYTNRNPQKVKRLVLIDPVVFAPSEDDIAPMALPLIGEYLAAVYLIPQLAAGQSGDFANKEAHPDWEDRFREQMQYHGFRAAILSTVRNFPAADTLGEYRDLGRKDLPVQLFWGRQDQTIPLEHSEKLLELVPQAQLNIIENAGHIPHFEQPDVVNPILIEFFRQ